MAQLTAIQANKLADNFLAMANEIGEYRYHNIQKLSASQNQEIGDLHSKALDYADEFYTLSATLVLDDVQASLEKIDGVTAEIKATYKQLQDVQKVINVAASVVTLGAAIINKNPQSIAEALDGLLDTWKS